MKGFSKCLTPSLTASDREAVQTALGLRRLELPLPRGHRKMDCARLGRHGGDRGPQAFPHDL